MVGREVSKPVPAQVGVPGNLGGIVVNPSEGDGGCEGQEGEQENAGKPEFLVFVQRRTFLLVLALGHGLPRWLGMTLLQNFCASCEGAPCGKRRVFPMLHGSGADPPGAPTGWREWKSPAARRRGDRRAGAGRDRLSLDGER